MSENLSAFFYLIASVCFILALRGLSSPTTARVGNIYGIAGMLIAVVTTLLTPHVVSFWLIILGILIGGTIGTFIALRIQMTALPQLVAAFHSLVGLAAVCVAAAAFYAPDAYGIGSVGAIERQSLIEMSLGTAIGAVTFTGSVVAFAKLHALIVTGALVGSSGAILSYIMCKGMNRSIFNVILGGFGTEGGTVAASASHGDKTVKSGSADDAAFILKNASSVIIVPGYGMAVAQ